MDLLTADVPKEGELFFRLNAFREGYNAEFLGHTDDGTDDRAAGLAHGGDEFHVDLKFVEFIVLQDVEGAIARAEVIHPNLIAGFAEAFDLVADIGVRGHDALGDFDMEQFARDAIFLNGPLDVGQDVAGNEVETGKVKGHRSDL